METKTKIFYITEKNCFQELQRIKDYTKALNPKKITINSTDYNKPIKKTLNFLLCCGVDVDFIIDNNYYKLQHQNTFSPAFWRIIARDTQDGYKELEQIEQNPNIKEILLYNSIDYMLSGKFSIDFYYNNVVQYKKIQKTKDFVKKWAPCFDIDTPMETSPSVVTDYKPLAYLKATNPNYDNLAQQLEKTAILKYYAKSHTAKVENLNEWKTAQQQIEFYLKNDIPMVKGWAVCEHCGNPLNKNKVYFENNREFSILDILETDTSKFYYKCEYCDKHFTVNL